MSGPESSRASLRSLRLLVTAKSVGLHLVFLQIRITNQARRDAAPFLGATEGTDLQDGLQDPSSDST